jgi:hypothetical protein
MGKLGGAVAETAYHLARVEGREHLETANEILHRGGSILLIGNHPNALGTAYAYGVVEQLNERNRRETVILMSSKFWDGRMGVFGDIAMQVVAVSGMKPAKVIQFYESGRDDERDANNLAAAMDGMYALKHPGGFVWVFPEGHRSPTGMIESQPSLERFACRADSVLSLVTPYGPFSIRPEVKILPLVDAQILRTRLTSDLGKEAGRQALADWLMTRIARQVSEEFQGFYKPFVEATVGRYVTEDYRLHNLSYAWSIFGENFSEYPS